MLRFRVLTDDDIGLRDDVERHLKSLGTSPGGCIFVHVEE